MNYVNLLFNKRLSRIGVFLLVMTVVALLLFFFFLTQKAPPPLPVGQSGSWNMIFDDEFDGTSLNLTKWHPSRLGYGDTAITAPVNSKEEECIDPQQISVRNGELDLNAIRSTCIVDGRSYNYRSALVQSDSHFNFRYGYMEVRMWTPGGSTINDWPAFWAVGKNWPQDGEIDVVEGLDSEPCWHFHYAGGAPGDCVNVRNPGSGWHTYAADWEPGVITYFYDGVRVGRVTSGVTSSPMYLVLSFGVSNEASPPIIVPATARFDYVRVWQK